LTAEYLNNNLNEGDQGAKQVPGQEYLKGSRFLSSVRSLIHSRGQYSPGRILTITIISIIFAEVIAMGVIYFFPFMPYYQQTILDVTIMTIVISPLLYILTFRPLLQYIQQQRQSENISQARLRLIQFSNTHSMNELLQGTLDELEFLTGSTIGFFHFLESDENMLWLQSWSTNTLQKMCTAEDSGSHYPIENAGIWADCVRQRQPVIHNDYASLLNRKGLPEGHATILREMAVPIIRFEKVVSIFGLGNKPQEYTSSDVELVSTLADFSWDIIERKRSELKVVESEEKFRTLADWTYDWEKWLDPDGNIVYNSPSCERITGYTPEDLDADPFLLRRIVHPEDRSAYDEHHKLVHDDSAGVVIIEYRIISRDGNEHWIEHICRPLFGKDKRYLGRRISNRDVTERKKAEKERIEFNQKEEILTRSIQTIQTDIARDLHDTLGQNISFLRMTLEHLSDTQMRDQVQSLKQIQSLAKAANESYELIRAMLFVLQPTDPADPLNLFNRYAAQISERSLFQVEITGQEKTKPLSPQQCRNLFYIFREALSNVEKYADPVQVSADFNWGEDGLTMTIVDDGRGFDPEQVKDKGHYGLRYMRERADLMKGHFSIRSAPGNGTSLVVQIPYEEVSKIEHQ